MVYGYRAIFVTLHTYLTKYKRDTVEKIIKAWVSFVENHTQVYIDSVVKWSGVPKDKILTEHSIEGYINIVAAMSGMENGIEADMADVKRGFVKMKQASIIVVYGFICLSIGFFIGRSTIDTKTKIEYIKGETVTG